MTDNEIAELRTAFDTLAHDVRSPLTSIAGFARLLLEDMTITGENREYVELIASDAERLTQLLTEGLAEIGAKLPQE